MTYVHADEVAGITLNTVDYAGLAVDPRFNQLVLQLAEFPTQGLASDAERLAFGINAYNILAMKLIVDHWPLASIKEIGTWFNPVWKREAGIVGGERLSLDELEHGRLRKMDTPLVHFAIVCASISCPDLRPEPYRAAILTQQLAEQTRQFLGNPGKGVYVEGGSVRVSQIFKWFGDDFSTAGGIEAFIRRYRELPVKARIKADLPYEWAVNARPPVPG